MNEYRPDHRRGGKDPDQRPGRPVPDVQDANERPAVGRREAPFDIHATGNTLDMAESDCRRRMIDFHLGQPPRGPARPGRTGDRPTSDESATVASPIPERARNGSAGGAPAIPRRVERLEHCAHVGPYELLVESSPFGARPAWDRAGRVAAATAVGALSRSCRDPGWCSGRHVAVTRQPMSPPNVRRSPDGDATRRRNSSPV